MKAFEDIDRCGWPPSQLVRPPKSPIIHRQTELTGGDRPKIGAPGAHWSSATVPHCGMPAHGAGSATRFKSWGRWPSAWAADSAPSPRPGAGPRLGTLRRWCK